MEKVLSDVRDGTLGQMLWYWMPVLLYASVIFYLSSLPHPEDTLPELLVKRLSDKLLHLVEYGICAALCYRALRWAAGPRLAPQAVILTIVAASVYGATDEIHQAFVPFRESSWLDWAADTVGATIGAVGASRLTQQEEPAEKS
jgi:VanZ family protein